MKILLLGDYSNVHATLAKGLRQAGHQVVLASDGDGWKNYNRDIDLKRKYLNPFYSLYYYLKVRCLFKRFKGFDVVQLINPVFLPLKAEKHYWFYHFLRKHNKKIFLAAFGMDYYWVKAGLEATIFKYSDFNLGKEIRESAENTTFIKDWFWGEKGRLNRFIAQDCDGIIAGLYEYWASYNPYWKNKMQFIPFPIHLAKHTFTLKNPKEKIRFFIGIQKQRNAYKGTDIMLKALERLHNKYPQQCEIIKVESVPYTKYIELMHSADVLLDQLYAYTPAMNALVAMAKGIVVVGGGEEENYAIIKEEHLRPILNVLPSEESVYKVLEEIVLHKENISQLSKDSLSYIQKHHDLTKVTKAYLTFWQNEK